MRSGRTTPATFWATRPSHSGPRSPTPLLRGAKRVAPPWAYPSHYCKWPPLFGAALVARSADAVDPRIRDAGRMFTSTLLGMVPHQFRRRKSHTSGGRRAISWETVAGPFAPNGGMIGPLGRATDRAAYIVAHRAMHGRTRAEPLVWPLAGPTFEISHAPPHSREPRGRAGQSQN